MDLPTLDLAMSDPILAAHVEKMRAEGCYENLCLLYVAMTRAKTAMYMVTEPVGTSKSANFPRLLRETLGEAWTAGDPQWFQAIPFATGDGEEGAAKLRKLEDPSLPASPRRPARRPSANHAGVVRAAEAFALDAAGGSDFG